MISLSTSKHGPTHRDLPIKGSIYIVREAKIGSIPHQQSSQNFADDSISTMRAKLIYDSFVRITQMLNPMKRTPKNCLLGEFFYTTLL